MQPHKESLEEYFVRITQDPNAAAEAGVLVHPEPDEKVVHA
jgi:hypothetical protein